MFCLSASYLIYLVPLILKACFLRLWDDILLSRQLLQLYSRFIHTFAIQVSSFIHFGQRLETVYPHVPTK